MALKEESIKSEARHLAGPRISEGEKDVICNFSTVFWA